MSDENKNFIETDEDKNQLINVLLEFNESLDSATFIVNQIQKLSFEDLTPEIWAGIVAHMPSLMFVLGMFERSIKIGGQVVDNATGLELVNKLIDENS